MTANPSSLPANSAPAPASMPAAAQFAFTPAQNLADAEAFVRRLAYGHYENFSVVSVLVPRHLRKDFCSIYAFCRMADDLGDELPDSDSSLHYLARFRQELHACYAGKASTAVFIALSQTIQRHDIPIQPFDDLISAFEQDQRVSRYDTLDGVLDYCRRSADPVGRLVLYVCGYRDEERQRLSDRTCTALQLANFWQDVRRDLMDLNRIYIPLDFMKRHGVSEEQLREGRAGESFCALMKELVDYTAQMFLEGQRLLPLLSRPVAGHVSLFGQGGQAILEAIRRQDYDTLTRRPTLSKWQKGQLIAKVLGVRVRECLSGGRGA